MEMYRIDAVYHHTEKIKDDKNCYVYALKGTPDAIVFYKNFIETECYQEVYCSDIKEYIFKTTALVEDNIQIGCILNKRGNPRIHMISEIEILRSDAEYWIDTLPERLKSRAAETILPTIVEREEEIKRKRKAC
jgi:hypothetical protein